MTPACASLLSAMRPLLEPCCVFLGCGGMECGRFTGASPLLENADDLLVASPNKEGRHVASVLLAHHGCSGFFGEPAVL